MFEEIKEIKSGKKQLRQFGIIFFVVFLVLSIAFFKHSHKTWSIFLLLAVIFLAVGIFIPFYLKTVYKIWMGLGIIIGYFVSRIILTMLFYLVVTPISLFARIIGKRFLSGFSKNTDTYWIPKETKEILKENYEKQY
ncbi:MAG: hypothetical protein A2539_02355 [Elusimicrobia bacterium RIFOXYD2_FULL_34_15]|nr:MAG: hypothetical protein A2539_02355 [Elusimicrobia bacterium RIFOXYD2_FULL_34_15]